jgi:hypothetical protein
MNRHKHTDHRSKVTPIARPAQNKPRTTTNQQTMLLIIHVAGLKYNQGNKLPITHITGLTPNHLMILMIVQHTKHNKGGSIRLG